MKGIVAGPLRPDSHSSKQRQSRRQKLTETDRDGWRDRPTQTCTDRQTDGRTDGRTDRQTDRQIDRERERHTHTYKYKYIYTYIHILTQTHNLSHTHTSSLPLSLYTLLSLLSWLSSHVAICGQLDLDALVLREWFCWEMLCWKKRVNDVLLCFAMKMLCWDRIAKSFLVGRTLLLRTVLVERKHMLRILICWQKGFGREPIVEMFILYIHFVWEAFCLRRFSQEQCVEKTLVFNKKKELSETKIWDI